ncbi:CHAT domain-containing protein [Mycena rosella]|uniref:CHAT domain-containing protein n=1 Tax=Mycena rosella TaxID=1033263 RepID=A0AAD7GGC5_MYCRO|nr:CHAT domain-containing protein [Mycena rosella]
MLSPRRHMAIAEWLPNETIIEILQGVSRPDQAALQCRVSKVFRALCLPVLYHIVDLESRASIEVSNSALSQFVRSFKFKVWNYSRHDLERGDEGRVSTSAYNLLANFSRPHTRPIQLLRDSLETLVNLEELSVDRVTITPSLRLHCTFPCLVKCTMGITEDQWTSTEREDSLASFLLRHPALKSLDIRDFRRLSDIWPPTSPRIPLLHLQCFGLHIKKHTVHEDTPHEHGPDPTDYLPRFSGLQFLWLDLGLISRSNDTNHQITVQGLGDVCSTLEACYLDQFIHSYTATLGSLLEAYNKKPLNTIPKFGVVGISYTGHSGTHPIEGVKDEVKKLLSIVQEPVECLQDDQATSDAVKLQLKACSWVHLACHGKQDLLEPSKSRLLLYDGNLELETILQMALSNAEFVFLAVCQTAMGDANLGIIAAGFRSAIGTMWAMNDQDGPLITEMVYSHLFRDGRQPQATDAAEALQFAVKGLRSRKVPFSVSGNGYSLDVSI